MPKGVSASATLFHQKPTKRSRVSWAPRCCSLGRVPRSPSDHLPSGCAPSPSELRFRPRLSGPHVHMPPPPHIPNCGPPHVGMHMWTCGFPHLWACGAVGLPISPPVGLWCPPSVVLPIWISVGMGDFAQSVSPVFPPSRISHLWACGAPHLWASPSVRLWFPSPVVMGASTSPHIHIPTGPHLKKYHTPCIRMPIS